MAGGYTRRLPDSQLPAMNEYIFFDVHLRDRFLAFLARHGLSGVTRPEPMGHLLVLLTDDLDDALDAAIEAEYEALMDAQRELLDQDASQDAYAAVGIRVDLPEGERMIRMPPEIARQLMQHLSTQEIHVLVTAVAQSLLAEADRPLCQR